MSNIPITSLPVATSLDGSEIVPLVQGGTTKRSTVIAIAVFAANASTQHAPTFVVSGSVYNSVATDTAIMIDLPIAAAISVVLLSAQSYAFPVLVKDFNGHAADATPITVTFSGGQTMDGLTQVVINNPYGFFIFNPLRTGNFYEA